VEGAKPKLWEVAEILSWLGLAVLFLGGLVAVSALAAAALLPPGLRHRLGSPPTATAAPLAGTTAPGRNRFTAATPSQTNNPITRS
jgi:hypothetical protein